jgi:hypothetical protein
MARCEVPARTGEAVFLHSIYTVLTTQDVCHVQSLATKDMRGEKYESSTTHHWPDGS